MEKKHIYYYDYLRIIALFCVIFMHSSSIRINMNFNKTWILLNILISFSYLAVPLFFMISGSLILNSEKTLNFKIYVKRLNKFIVPILTWNLVIAILNQFISINDDFNLSIFKIFFLGFKTPIMIHLWFMYILIPIYIISPFLYAGLKNMNIKFHKLFKIIIFILLSYFAIKVFYKNLRIDILEKISFFDRHLISFLIGYYLVKCKKIPNSILIIIFIFDLFIITYFTYNKTILNGFLFQDFQMQNGTFEIVLAASLFLFFKQNFNFKAKYFYKFVENLSKLSFSIYIIHNIIIRIIFIKFSFFDFYTFKGVIIITITTFFISYLISFLLSKIKYINYFFTAIK